MDNGMPPRVFPDLWRIGLLMVGLTAGAVAQPSFAAIDLRVDDPRPVSRAIDEITKKVQYPISYEDPQFAYSDDLRDVTDEVSNGRAKSRIVVPAGGSLEVRQLSIAGAEPKVLATQALQQIVNVQANRASGGRFRVEQSGEMLHVVPTSIRNGQGEWIEQGSILRHRISIPAAERSPAEMLNAICSALTQTTGVTVGLASGPLRTLNGTKSVQVANNEPARDVLIRTLNQAGGYMTWKLFYAPDQKWHALNIIATPRRKSS
jgi:hypothetical protein